MRNEPQILFPGASLYARLAILPCIQSDQNAFRFAWDTFPLDDFHSHRPLHHHHRHHNPHHDRADDESLTAPLIDQILPVALYIIYIDAVIIIAQREVVIC